MSFNLMQMLEDWYNKTRKYDPIGHKVADAAIKNDSRNAQHIGHFLDWKYLADEGKQNEQNTARGASRGLLGAASVFGGMAAYPYLAGAGAGTQASAATTGAGVLASSGMFAADAAPAVTENIAMQEELAAAAKEKAAGGLMGGGLFGQVPGAGAEQSAMLNAQTDIFGGQGANMTAQSAMPALRDARAAGTLGRMDFLKGVAQSDLAGMNDPAVWGDRLSRGMDRLAGSSYGKSDGAQLPHAETAVLSAGADAAAATAADAAAGRDPESRRRLQGGSDFRS
jgi:hypothetical protein